MKNDALLFLILLILLGSGCIAVSPKNIEVKPQSIDQTQPKKLAFFSSPTSSSPLIIYQFATSMHRFRFVYDQTPKTIASWREVYPTATLIANALYFLEDNSPAGSLIINGEQKSTRRFDNDKSGMIDLSNDLRIMNTKNEAFDPTASSTAGQSYPFLITDGKAAITKDSGLIARRTFIGTDTQNRIYIGLLQEPKSLFSLMNLLLSLEIQWKHALNLDGGPSSGISFRTNNTNELFNSLVPIPIVIIAE